MGRRRRRWHVPTHPKLFPDPEAVAPLSEDALREAVRGLADLLLASIGVLVTKGGEGESQDPS